MLPQFDAKPFIVSANEEQLPDRSVAGDAAMTCWEPAVGARGLTPLHVAAFRSDVEGALAAIEAGADINARDHDGRSPLHWLVDMGRVGEGREDILAALIKAGAEIDPRNHLGETPLLRVCSSGNEDLARLLIEAGANLAARDKEGWSPLGLAVREGYEETVAVLLDHGASPQEATPSSIPVLDYSREHGHHIATLLLESWNDAKQLGTDWLALLANAPEDFDEVHFLKHLDAIMLGSGIILGLRSTFPDPMDDASEELPAAGKVRDDFIADYHRFLDRTSLVFPTSYYSKELCLVFRTQFRYTGSAEDWAKIQTAWADRTRYRGHRWAWKNFYYACKDVEMLTGIKRLVEILKRHRNPPRQ